MVILQYRSAKYTLVITCTITNWVKKFQLRYIIKYVCLFIWQHSLSQSCRSELAFPSFFTASEKRECTMFVGWLVGWFSPNTLLPQKYFVILHDLHCTSGTYFKSTEWAQNQTLSSVTQWVKE